MIDVLVTSSLQNSRIIASKLLVVPVLALALFTHHSYAEDGLVDKLLETTGYLLLQMSALGRIWASAHIDGRKSKQLVTQGPFSITRNPLYVFSFLGFLGAGLAFVSLTIAAALVLIFFLLHWPTILAEEKNLYAVFGEEYQRYVNRVPRFMPRSLQVEYSDSAQFYPKVFARSMFECSLVGCVFILAHLVEWSHDSGILPVLFLIP